MGAAQPRVRRWLVEGARELPLQGHKSAPKGAPDSAVKQQPVEEACDPARGSYSTTGSDPVADVESAFSVTDVTPVDGTPLDVLRECEWTWICTPPRLGPDIHANTTGYGVIAQAFADQLAP